MKTSDLDHYFEAMAQQFTVPAKIILIGGAAALLMGGVRPTHDVDFEINTKASNDEVKNGIQKGEIASGLSSEFSTDIERWSMLNMPNYQKHVTLYKKFGKVKVFVLKPEYWSIGKVGRYLDSDIQDMISVFKVQKTKPNDLIKVWQQVLQKSPLSDELFHFKVHAQHFMKEVAPKIWGTSYSFLNAK